MIHYKTIDVTEHNLVAWQIVKYHIHHVGGLRGVVSHHQITLELCPVWPPTLQLEEYIKFLNKEVDRQRKYKILI